MSPAPTSRESNLPRPERASIILTGHRRGDSITDIARALSPTGRSNGGVFPVIRNVLADPEMYDPHVDEVAVERAFHGDRDTWDAMTHYERAALVDLVIEKAESGATNSGWPGHPAMYPGAEIDHERGWVYLLAERLGMSPHRFRKTKNKRASARRLKDGKSPS